MSLQPGNRIGLGMLLAIVALATAGAALAAVLVMRDDQHKAAPTTVVVPDVAGRSVSDARLLLRQVGLTVGDVQWGATGASVADASAVVVSQSPPAGSQAASGSKVNLSVGTRTP